MFTPNNISEQEYDEAIALGVKLNIDNLNALEYVGHKHPGTPVCIRINPHMMAGGNRKISVGHIDSKFGISIHQVPHIKRVVKSHDIPVEGIHVHTGSDILDSSVFIRASELIFSVVEEFPEVDYIDFGSGFKIAYKEGDLCTDIPAFGREFSAAFNAFCEKMGRDYTLKFEAGQGAGERCWPLPYQSEPGEADHRVPLRGRELGFQPPDTAHVLRCLPSHREHQQPGW
jgi:diaminopimelate decarboxylase